MIPNRRLRRRMAEMNGIIIEHSNRGGVDKFVSKILQKPGKPEGHDILVR